MGYKISTGAFKYPFSFRVDGPGGGGGSSTSPSAQQNFPTSTYGQTVPVLYGKARISGAYVWAPAVIVKSSSSTSFSFASGFTTETDVDVILNCRIRFGAPLVPDSEWSLRRLWADGRLILDASTGYRWGGLKYRFYDGQSTQGRDPTMVDEEGEENVSAHRGYIDIVIRDYNMGEANQPPVFEAEVVQGTTTSYDTDVFTTFFADTINTVPALHWDGGVFYGVSNTPGLLRKFSIGDLREIYAVPLSGLPLATILETDFRYIPEIDRILAFSTNFSTSQAVLIDPATGAVTATGLDAISPYAVNTSCHVRIGNTSLLIGSVFITEELFVFRIGDDSVSLSFTSGAGWNGYAAIESIAAGTARSADADLWICADDKLVKAKVTAGGAIIGATEHATLPNNGVYAVFYDDDVVVWTSNLQVRRIDGATGGATVWTQTVPYQITTTGSFNRLIAAPDVNRFDDELLYEDSDNYYFTSLKTGETRTVFKGSSLALFRFAYDGESDWQITTDTFTVPDRTTFGAGGTERSATFRTS
ncbi:hypothetical protein ACG873_30275 [Mesorhizobium sp. AaZ16]|uniref:hypothetical protein n=1 Tax=Mesorhizobium sp. AaZ16 TaxID=3402289 RepID=UPI00374F36E1